MLAKIIDQLRCPKTGNELKLVSKGQSPEVVLEGTLKSVNNPSLNYLIKGGIPRFVDFTELSDLQRETIEAFSEKWRIIPDYASGGATKRIRESWYFERFGFTEGDKSLKQFLQNAETILEAGTGAGVDTDILYRNSQGNIFGVDISEGIEVAYQRFKDIPRVLLFQADIANLPFPDNFFDVISCDQVLHHTPDPKMTFQHLVRKLKRGGKILLYVYKVKGALREFSDEYLRKIYTNSTHQECMEFSQQMTELGRQLSSLKAEIQIEKEIKALGIKPGIYDLQRLIYDHVIKCFWNDAYDFETNAAINYDWYRPLHAFRYTPEEIEQWFTEEALTLKHKHVCPSGISVIGEKS